MVGAKLGTEQTILGMREPIAVACRVKIRLAGPFQGGCLHGARVHPVWSLQHGSCLLLKVNFRAISLPACCTAMPYHGV
ncbi:hypothetical protein V5799_013714 [Amblyomma americanum]|uniref:Uncharacterized protein n=1 Tax=Amblyomma americanum TaxID=6943 RepID=A0AAQ4E5A5_AMBAM